MEHNYEFKYKRIILKPLQEKDIQLLRVLRNKEKQFFSTIDEISEEAQVKWYETYLKKNDDIMFKVVLESAPEEFIGAIAIYDIDFVNRTAEVGRTVIDKDKATEKGIGTEATKAICKFGFDELKMSTLFGKVLKSNERIIKVDKRVGFYITGEVDEATYSIEITNETLNA